MNEKEFRKLLKKAATGNASVRETKLLEKMMMGLRGPSVNPFDRKDSRNRVYDRLLAKIRFSSGRKLSLQVLGYAASLIILVSIGFLVWNSRETQTHSLSEVPYLQINTGKGERKTILLPDSSLVTLNSSSSLIYPEKFNGSKRHVNISGEAFFNVHRDESKPFSIRAGDIIVTVLGTSFNVFEDIEAVMVTVESGVVKVEKDRAEGHAILGVNQQFTYRKQTHEGWIASTDAKKVSDWSRNILEFDNLELKEALEIIAEWFNVKIECHDEEILERTLKGKYQDKSLEYILEDLNFMMDLNYQVKSDTIILTSKNE